MVRAFGFDRLGFQCGVKDVHTDGSINLSELRGCISPLTHDIVFCLMGIGAGESGDWGTGNASSAAENDLVGNEDGLDSFAHDSDTISVTLRSESRGHGAEPERELTSAQYAVNGHCVLSMASFRVRGITACCGALIWC